MLRSLLLAVFVLTASRAPADVVHAGPGATQEQIAWITEGLNTARAQFDKMTGVTPKPLDVYASTDPEYLLLSHMRGLGSPSARPKGLLNEYQECAFAALQTRRIITMCLQSELWRDPWQPRGGLRARYLAVTAHEYFHAIQTTLARSKPPGPRWLSEGSAEVMSWWLMNNLGYGGYDEATAIYRKRAHRTGYRLENIEGRITFYAGETGDQAALAWVGTQYLIDTYGLNSLIDFWRQVGRGTKEDRAWERAFGVSKAQFYRDFAARL